MEPLEITDIPQETVYEFRPDSKLMAILVNDEESHAELIELIKAFTDAMAKQREDIVAECVKVVEEMWPENINVRRDDAIAKIKLIQ